MRFECFTGFLALRAKRVIHPLLAKHIRHLFHVLVQFLNDLVHPDHTSRNRRHVSHLAQRIRVRVHVFLDEFLLELRDLLHYLFE